MTTVFYPPTIPWGKLTQRPQQLMRWFAELGWTAVYHDIGMQRVDPPVVKVRPGLYLLSRYARPEALHDKVNLTRPIILWITYPPHSNLVGTTYDEDLVVFDICDMPSEEFLPWKKWVKEMLSKASVVFTASQVLYDAFSRSHPSVHCVPNGADWQHFAPASRTVPEDFPRRAGRVAGYHGALASWLDWRLIQRVAEAMPDWNFVFVGPLLGLDPKWLPKRSNMFYLGEKSYEELPSYAGLFDVGTVPFEVREVTVASDPIKVYEYLASGKPVVTTNLPAVAGRPGVYLARNEEEFAAMLEKAVSEDSAARRGERLAFARENSWENRARRIMTVVNDAFRSGVG